jgi:hypothetical protein
VTVFVESPLLFSMAGSTPSPTLRRDTRIFFGEFMPSLAVRPVGLEFLSALCNFPFVLIGHLVGDFLGGNALVKSKPAFRPVDNSVSLDPVFPEQFLSKVLLTLNSYPSVVSPVSLLLGACSPSAIFRGIGSIVVNSVEGVSIWARSHIGNKSVEVLLPSLTNVYPPCAVIRVAGMGGVIAALFHVLPSIVKWRYVLKRHGLSSSCITSHIMPRNTQGG